MLDDSQSPAYPAGLLVVVLPECLDAAHDCQHDPGYRCEAQLDGALVVLLDRLLDLRDR